MSSPARHSSRCWRAKTPARSRRSAEPGTRGVARWPPRSRWTSTVSRTAFAGCEPPFRDERGSLYDLIGLLRLNDPAPTHRAQEVAERGEAHEGVAALLV